MIAELRNNNVEENDMVSVDEEEGSACVSQENFLGVVLFWGQVAKKQQQVLIMSFNRQFASQISTI